MKENRTLVLGDLKALCLGLEGQLRDQMVELVRVQNRLRPHMPREVRLERLLDPHNLPPAISAYARLQELVQFNYTELIGNLRELRGVTPSARDRRYQVWGDLAVDLEIRAAQPDLREITDDQLGEPS